MRWKAGSVAVLGALVFAVGCLWLLQGSDVVRIDPVLCVGECEPLVGRQPAWQLTGGAAMVTGALTTGTALRKLRGRVEP
jgi:hypothetical protein